MNMMNHRGALFLLAMNAGSSSLKFEAAEAVPGTGRVGTVASGIVDGIGKEAVLRFRLGSVEEARPQTIPDHGAAARVVLEWLETHVTARFDAIGHRVVHGGTRLTSACVATQEVLDEIRSLVVLAPLHNTLALEVIHAAQQFAGAKTPHVVTFDTAFHGEMPDRSRLYAIPPALAEKHRIYRYGFHGLAHRSMVSRYAAACERDANSLKIITLQLGNGCSAAAIDRGRSVDTTMGLTPLEGLMMGTRSGDVDPALPAFLAGQESAGIDEVESWLNKKSGLLGISGLSQDVRRLLAAEAEGHPGSALALEMFCYRIRKQIGAYMAVLDGADALVFGGGIGENAAPLRERICRRMDWCGITLDEARNARCYPPERRISADESRVEIHTVAVDEAAVILNDTLRCLISNHARAAAD